MLMNLIILLFVKSSEACQCSMKGMCDHIPIDFSPRMISSTTAKPSNTKVKSVGFPKTNSGAPSSSKTKFVLRKIVFVEPEDEEKNIAEKLSATSFKANFSLGNLEIYDYVDGVLIEKSFSSSAKGSPESQYRTQPTLQPSIKPNEGFKTPDFPFPIVQLKEDYVDYEVMDDPDDEKTDGGESPHHSSLKFLRTYKLLRNGTSQLHFEPIAANTGRKFPDADSSPDGVRHQKNSSSSETVFESTSRFLFPSNDRVNQLDSKHSYLKPTLMEKQTIQYRNGTKVINYVPLNSSLATIRSENDTLFIFSHNRNSTDHTLQSKFRSRWSEIYNTSSSSSAGPEEESTEAKEWNVFIANEKTTTASDHPDVIHGSNEAQSSENADDTLIIYSHSPDEQLPIENGNNTTEDPDTLKNSSEVSTTSQPGVYFKGNKVVGNDTDLLVDPIIEFETSSPYYENDEDVVKKVMASIESITETYVESEFIDYTSGINGFGVVQVQLFVLSTVGEVTAFLRDAFPTKKIVRGFKIFFPSKWLHTSLQKGQ